MSLGTATTHLLVVGFYGAASPGLSLDGFHGRGVKSLLGGGSTRVGLGRPVCHRVLPLRLVDVVDGHQQAVIHDFEALQDLGTKSAKARSAPPARGNSFQKRTQRFRHQKKTPSEVNRQRPSPFHRKGSEKKK